MSAVGMTIRTTADLPDAKRVQPSIFRSPFSSWSPGELLSYVQQRDSVSYFPVVDEFETAAEKIDAILCNRFEFNFETYAVGGEIPWLDNPSADVEWQILLHKFYYSVGLGIAFEKTRDPIYASKWVELTESWIDTVSHDYFPGDVTGRRIQNWIFAHYFFVTRHKAKQVTPVFYTKFLNSLVAQVDHLSGHMAPSRNHRTIELCAIFLSAVVFPELRAAKRWLELAIAELATNIGQDFNQDGVHCEQSTDYHHLVLKNFLWVKRLATLNNIPLPDIIDQRLRSALEFALYIHRPDGDIPALSDGDSRSFTDLLLQGYEFYGDERLLYVATSGRQGVAPRACSAAFPDSGYYVLRSGWGQSSLDFRDELYMVLDCGPLGIGNHGHFDANSVEIAAYGRPLIIDPGRYTYDETGDINWRVRFRGTEYHNTVLVDGKNQTNYKAGKSRYKIKGPPPECEVKSFVSRDSFDYLHGIVRSHQYPVVHERKIMFVMRRYWVVVDVMRASEQHDYNGMWHLHYEAQGHTQMQLGDGTATLTAPHLSMTFALLHSDKVEIEDGFVSETYGEKRRAPVVRFQRYAASTSFATVIVPYRRHAPKVKLETTPVSIGAYSCDIDESISLRIVIAEGTEVSCDELAFSPSNDDSEPTEDIADQVSWRRYDGRGKLIMSHCGDARDCR